MDLANDDLLLDLAKSRDPAPGAMGLARLDLQGGYWSKKRETLEQERPKTNLANDLADGR